MSNPKAIAFSTALFPQFINPDKAVPLQFCILVTTFMGMSFACLLGYSLVADRARNRRLRLPAALNKLFGTAFIGSGVALAATGQG